MINIQLVEARLPVFIVREGARPLVRFKAFDFLLSGVKTCHHAAAVMASTCRIPDWSEDASFHKRQTQKNGTIENNHSCFNLITSCPFMLSELKKIFQIV